MTENKRFKCVSDYDWWGVIDITGEIKGEYDNDCFSTDTVVDLLNELAEENRQCKEYNAKLYSNSMKSEKQLLKQIKELKEENKELKQLIGVIDDLIDGYIALADKYRKPIKSLAIGDDLGYWNGVYQYMKKLRERIGVL